MAAAYFENGFLIPASFELFVRSLPPERSYLVAAGLEQALDYLATIRFQPEDIEFLRRQPVFRHISDGFFDYLKAFRFTGEVWAIPEGTPVFTRSLFCGLQPRCSKPRSSKHFCYRPSPSRPRSRRKQPHRGSRTRSRRGRIRHPPCARTRSGNSCRPCRLPRRVCRDLKRRSREAFRDSYLRHDGALFHHGL